MPPAGRDSPGLPLDDGRASPEREPDGLPPEVGREPLDGREPEGLPPVEVWRVDPPVDPDVPGLPPEAGRELDVGFPLVGGRDPPADLVLDEDR